MKKIILIWVLICFQNAFSQSIEAKVIDENNQPLVGAAVYFDGTTRGVITNVEGNFKITIPANLFQPRLVISYMGYKTIVEKNPVDIKPKYQLRPQTNTLDSVNLYTQHFSRKQMERAFKAHFLGLGKEANKCEITNMDDVILYYTTKDNTLHAEAYKPIIVKNNYLGYTVKFDLQDFEVNFRTKSLKYFNFKNSYYRGYPFFKDMNPGKKDRRLKTYRGSKKHFLKTLINNEITGSGYKIHYLDNSPREQNEIFGISKLNQDVYEVSLNKIIVENEKGNGPVEIVINYKNENTTLRFLKNSFLVDRNGNEMNIKPFSLIGDFATYKIAKTLPSDFNFE